ncbi:MAG: hypothetical protein MJ198_10685 [Bacteroidales bacterium]|nr:hypothetical protein [Bacteroidales bacterium]
MEQITNYFTFMYRKWNKKISQEIFGPIMGEHFYQKWTKLTEIYNEYGAMAKFWDELSEGNRKILYDYITNKKN